MMNNPIDVETYIVAEMRIGILLHESAAREYPISGDTLALVRAEPVSG